MPETNYTAEPRPTPLVTPPSRHFADDIRFNLYPSAPAAISKPVISYDAAGTMQLWNPVTHQWISLSAGGAAGLDSEVSDSVAFDRFEDYDLGAISALSEGTGWGANGVVTGGTIVSRTNSGARADQRLSLAAGELIRKMPWAEKWKAIRIGLCMRVNGVATFNGDFNIGVCSGSTFGFSSASCVNWIGGTTRNGNTNAFTFGAGSDAAVYTASLRGHGTKVGASFTDTGGISSANHFSALEANRIINIVDIRRARWGVTSNTYVCKTLGPGSAITTLPGSAETDSDASMMLQALMLGDISTTILWFYDGASSSTNVTHSETAGPLDNINIAWTAATPLELSAIGVCKLA